MSYKSTLSASILLWMLSLREIANVVKLDLVVSLIAS